MVGETIVAACKRQLVTAVGERAADLRFYIEQVAEWAHAMNRHVRAIPKAGSP